MEPLQGRKLTQYEIADAWARITIKRWRRKMHQLKIGQTDQLYYSFLKEVVGAANGDLIKIDFAFKYYGKFTDMGVGRGRKMADVGPSRTSLKLRGRMLGGGRKPKKWYSPTFFAEVGRLREILAEHYAHLGALTIVENIGDNSITR